LVIQVVKTAVVAAIQTDPHGTGEGWN
jgi:hypothetical protein